MISQVWQAVAGLTLAIRSRPDTIRCIVANLVGDKESGDSLADIDEPVQPLSQIQMEDYSDPNWEPEPTDAGPDFRTNKPSDTISTLVSIYDSKDLFIKELQVLLAQRLLAIQDGDFDNEVRSFPFSSSPCFPWLTWLNIFLCCTVARSGGTLRFLKFGLGKHRCRCAKSC